MKRRGAGYDLTYFTHVIDGRRYGGWYRLLKRKRAIEVYSRADMRTVVLPKGQSPREQACSALEDIIKTQAGRDLRLPHK